MDESCGLCIGCLRTIDEIAAWSGLDDKARQAVWAELPKRRAERAVRMVKATDVGDDSRP